MDKARNDLSAAVPKFALALEEHRRTPDGRVRTSQEMLASFFPHDDKTSTDRIFKYLPNEVRGPVIAAWGIRGIKAALRDNDEKVQSVVYDALIAGDVDHAAFEDGLTPDTLVRWIPLSDLWAFWRGGKLTKQALHKALSVAYELSLFDARWFLDTLSARGGSIKGTDVLADGLTKEDLTQWIRRIQETGDGTPKGIVAALGWDKIVAKTANEVLIAVLDAMVAKAGIVSSTPPKESAQRLPESSYKAPESSLRLPPESSPSFESKVETHVPSVVPPPLPPIPAIPLEVQASNGEGSRPTEKPPIDDGAWSMPPAPPPSDEAIQVAVDDDDEVIISDRSPTPTPPRTAVVAPLPDDSAPLKTASRLRFAGLPFKPGGPSKR